MTDSSGRAASFLWAGADFLFSGAHPTPKAEGRRIRRRVGNSAQASTRVVWSFDANSWGWKVISMIISLVMGMKRLCRLTYMTSNTIGDKFA